MEKFTSTLYQLSVVMKWLALGMFRDLPQCLQPNVSRGYNCFPSHPLVKGKGKIDPVFNQALRYEDVLGSGGIALLILNLDTIGEEWPALRSGHFTPGERAPVVSLIEGWMGPRAGLNTAARRKIPALTRIRTPAVQSVVSHYY
jgi:hypothetical protein